MKKRLIKIVKLSGLLLIRQMWTTVCNLYLLISEPFLTVRRIRTKKDKSQIVILTCLLISPAVLYVMVRIITDLWWYKKLLLSVGSVFGLIFLLEFLMVIYIFYWIYQVITKNHLGDFKERI